MTVVTTTTHVNINGGLFEAEIDDTRTVIEIVDLPAGQIPVLGQAPFPVIVDGQSGQGRLRDIRIRDDRTTLTTIAAEFS